MDPEPDPEHKPIEAPSTVPEPMTMERSLSQESGSDSSASTVYFTKVSKSGSAASSRSGSVKSTSRWNPDQEVPTGSPSLGQGQGEGRKEDDQPSSTIVAPSSEEGKKNESTRKIEEDRTGASAQAKGGTKTKEAGKTASDQIASETATTKAAIRQDAEHRADECCSCCARCCPSCAKWGFARDVAAVLCCPVTVITLLSSMCFRCRKMFSTKIAETVKTTKARAKGEDPHAKTEHFELEPASTDKSPRSGSQKGSGKHMHSTAGTPAKSPRLHSEQPKSFRGFDSHQNYFFPSPEVEDDHPGGKKPGPR